MSTFRELAVNYDAQSDVLYLAVGAPVPADTDEDDDGLLVRFAKTNGKPCGVTVLGFASNWTKSTDRLANLIGSHLQMPRSAVAAALAGVRRG
jgi:uncharacterized protein YuzE